MKEVYPCRLRMVADVFHFRMLLTHALALYAWASISMSAPLTPNDTVRSNYVLRLHAKRVHKIMRVFSPCTLSPQPQEWVPQEFIAG